MEKITKEIKQMDRLAKDIKEAIPILKRLIKAHKEAGRTRSMTFSEGELFALKGILKMIKGNKYYQRGESKGTKE